MHKLVAIDRRISYAKCIEKVVQKNKCLFQTAFRPSSGTVDPSSINPTRREGLQGVATKADVDVDSAVGWVGLAELPNQLTKKP